MEKKLVIVDGNSVLYREFFALPSLTSPSGEPTGAIYGFSRHIIEILTKIKPSHIVIAFDAGKHTFRNDLFVGYKATRKPMPEDLRAQLIPLKKLLDEMNIFHIEVPGIEGDDVIGSLASKFNMPTIIVTGDRDSFQLVNSSTVVYLNRKGLSDVRVMDEQAIMETFGVAPSQMVEIKALQGDSSDNIPGVKGVGEKTALSLIQKYKSVDGVYEHIEEISGSTKIKLIDGKNDAYMSLSLAKIKTDAELKVELSDLEVKFPFSLEVRKMFSYYGFRSLATKEELFNLTNKEQIEEKTIIIEEELQEGSQVDVYDAFNGETELGVYAGEEYLIISNGIKCYKVKLNNECAKIKLLMENEKIAKVVFDNKKLKHSLIKVGILLKGLVFDCMIAKHLVSGRSVVKLEDLISGDVVGEGTIVKNLIALKGELEENLNRMNMASLYSEIELPLSGLLFEMEQSGFKIDIERLKEQEQKFESELNSLTKAIYESVGKEFNINSPKQLGEIVYDELKLAKSKKKSTASEKLEKLVDKHPVISMVMRYRKISKFLSSFIKNMYDHIDNNGFVHTNFNQTLTTTGRLSSSEPNLQNVPIRGDESREIRSMFVARSSDNVLIDADYSQIELRIMAHITKDDLLIEAFQSGQDIHTQTAMKVFGVKKEDVTKEMRRTAKVVNFGVNYGISEYGLAADLNVSAVEARRYIENFFIAHPKVRAFMDEAAQMARETGRVTTLLGRTRTMDEINDSNFMVRSRAERAAYNMPIQGSAADIIKIAMLNVDRAIKSRNLKAKLIMQVHDELIIDCPKEEAKVVQEIVVNEMKNALKLDVPLDVDSVVSFRWSEGH